MQYVARAPARRRSMGGGIRRSERKQRKKEGSSHINRAVFDEILYDQVAYRRASKKQQQKLKEGRQSRASRRWSTSSSSRQLASQADEEVGLKRDAGGLVEGWRKEESGHKERQK